MKRRLITADNTPEGKLTVMQDLFPIVGIGASAGGLEAFEFFFEHLPPGNRIAFIIVQHLDPTHKAMLSELLQRITKLKVVEVTDNLKIEPDFIYVIPPNKSMSVLNRTLYLFEPVETHGMRLPIDFFFRSMADDLKEKSIAIILSGMGSDGVVGIRAVKEQSGIVMVQDPASAKFDGMPRSAIAAVTADFIAPPELLPGKLLSYLKTKSLVRPGQDIKTNDESSVEKIILLLRTYKGNDFSLYKKTTINRRILRRLEIHKISNLRSYLHYLQETPAELEILFKELLIGVTGFFRDPVSWERLKEEILPALLSKANENETFRAWIPACATGEDAYSLAIIFSEMISSGKYKKGITLKIFATDINADSIDSARSGLFISKMSSEVSESRLNSFFSRTEKGYRINSHIREMLVFAPQNLIKDPPFTKMDIIICRNLMIYFEHELQKKVLKIFHYSLNPGGLLMLGNEESTGALPSLFNKTLSRLRIYSRSDTLPESETMDFNVRITDSNLYGTETLIPMKASDNIQKLTDDILLNQYSPASVLVNANGDILYITGRTGKYLEPASGKANMNIFSMLREDLRLEFPYGFKKALQSYDKVLLPNLKISSDDRYYFLEIIIQQIEKPPALKGLLIIIFKDMPDTPVTNSAKAKKSFVKGHITTAEDSEIIRLKKALKSTIEAVQASEEELKSSNEELQSTNEELQSTNEELTTSKEEMQSMNEELQTVNIELLNKIEDFTNTNNDLKNLLESTEIATLFLDKGLNVRRFTNLVSEIFNLLPGDLGRPIKDFSTNMIYPGIFDDSKKVLLTLIFVEKEVMTQSGNWYKVRIMPYRTTDDMIDGLVITFTDITRAKKLEIELNKTISKLVSTNQNRQ